MRSEEYLTHLKTMPQGTYKDRRCSNDYQDDGCDNDGDDNDGDDNDGDDFESKTLLLSGIDIYFFETTGKVLFKLQRISFISNVFHKVVFEEVVVRFVAVQYSKRKISTCMLSNVKRDVYRIVFVFYSDLIDVGRINSF